LQVPEWPVAFTHALYLAARVCASAFNKNQPKEIEAL
jgi:hypothetical protein